MQEESFLDLYNSLEQALKGKGRYYNDKYESPIVRFTNTNEGKEYREVLSTIRDIRNLLVHNPQHNGQPPVTPSDDILAVLKEIVHKVENPKVAMDFATGAKAMMTATLSDEAFTVMREMELKGYSHVPVLNDHRMMGVFSKGTVFTFLIQRGLDSIERGVKISEFKNWLPVRNHSSEYYEFTAQDTIQEELLDRFEASYARRSRRLAAIFVTENGNPTEKLLGMITPWDILGDKD